MINSLPDGSLIDAYKAGFIYVQLVKDWDEHRVGEWCYDGLYNHDTIGILAWLLTIGDFDRAPERLSKIPWTHGTHRYNDGIYKQPWPYAIYLLKTGDTGAVSNVFANCQTAVNHIHSDRTGPDGVIKQTWSIDATGNWVLDDWSALVGLYSYKYICERLNRTSDAQWAESEYNSLLNSTNTVLSRTIDNNGLSYIPCSITQPNTQNRCNDPRDANWAVHFHFGRWPWDGFLLGGVQNGYGISKLDDTYDYGFARLAAEGYPAHTFGGFPSGWFATGYTVAYGSGGLRAERYREQWYDSYRFLLDNAMSGPNSYFEGIDWPGTMNWEGTHPEDGYGSSPHGWGIVCNNKVFIEAMIAERFDGTVIVGRGIPGRWLNGDDSPIDISNVPITDNRRMGYHLTSDGEYIEITFTGDDPVNDIWVDLPVFIGNDVFNADKGVVDYDNNRLILPSDTDSVIISLSGIPPIPPPSNVQATPLSGSAVQLSWQDNTHGVEQEEEFVIQRRPYLGNGVWHEVGRVGADITTYTDADEVYGMIAYSYRVGAVKQ